MPAILLLGRHCQSVLAETGHKRDASILELCLSLDRSDLRVSSAHSTMSSQMSKYESETATGAAVLVDIIPAS